MLLGTALWCRGEIQARRRETDRAAFLAGILGAEQLTGLIDALGGAFGLIFGMTGACGLLLLISISSALGVVTG